MDYKRLVKSININGSEFEINSDYRDIINIFSMFTDPDLLDEEKTYIAVKMFYCDCDKLKQSDYEEASKELFNFINMGNDYDSNANSKPLYDWEQDYSIIIAPINKVLGYDVRGVEYLHWWTFLSAFMEIGECSFSTYVGIRDKLNHGKKLEKYEEKILRENKSAVILKKRVDKSTQELLDSIQ